MAPVARRVTDGQENRLVFLAGFLQRFIAPREPIHRIVSVLEKIGTLLVYESVSRHGLKNIPVPKLKNKPSQRNDRGERKHRGRVRKHFHDLFREKPKLMGQPRLKHSPATLELEAS